jgi:hypothetical protein
MLFKLKHQNEFANPRLTIQSRCIQTILYIRSYNYMINININELKSKLFSSRRVLQKSKFIVHQK